MLVCGFAEFLYGGLHLSFKAQCLPQINWAGCLAGCHVVEQTLRYHLLCILSSLVKFHGGGGGGGGGVVVKFDVFLHSYVVCLCFVDWFWETSFNEKWGELGKWLCNR